MAREAMLDIGEKLAGGAPSVFNAVAHYGIVKKGPLYLMEGYRHIFVEGSLSRTISAMGHFMLSDVCELTGLWGPNLFSYRKGISPFTMVLVMRRSMYKILHSWGQIWILDWDESGAFPKLAMGIMDEVLGIAD